MAYAGTKSARLKPKSCSMHRYRIRAAPYVLPSVTVPVRNWSLETSLEWMSGRLGVGLDLHDSIKMMANRRARVTRAFDKALSKRILASAHDVRNPA